MRGRAGLQVIGVRMVPGFSAGLDEATAIVDLAWGGDVGDAGSDQRLRAGIATVCPEWPLYGVDESDWPRPFLVEAAGPDAAGEVRLGEWVVALAVGLQQWVRHPVWRGRVVDAGPGRLRVAIPWHHEMYFRRLLEVAVGLVDQWWRSDPDPVVVAGLLGEFRAVLEESRPQRQSPRMLRFIRAAVERDIPFRLVPDGVRFGWGADAEQLFNCYTSQTSLIAAGTAQNKMATKSLLAQAGVPVPPGDLVGDAEQAVAVAQRLGWPVVAKPADLDNGVAVTPGIDDEGTLRQAYEQAAEAGRGRVIVEQHVPGHDYRIVVVAGRLLGAHRKVPGGVTGDGVHSIAELVELVNADPRRGSEASSQLKRLIIDEEAIDVLADQRLTLDSLPPSGYRVTMRRIANMSGGGSAVDETELIHPDNRRLAERTARVIGLDIVGIDFLTTDISRSWREVGGAVCEVNDQPGFWLLSPDRDMAGEILDVVMGGRSGRIPTAAITGTNGKTTTTAMLHRIWLAAGRRAGMCTTAGVWIGDDLVSTENLSGYPGSVMLLTDPEVEAAVLEMPRKGLILFGHGCDRYDVAALLNVSDDHLGADGVETLEQMAELKAEVLARASGAVVVNAEDPLCMGVLSRAGTGRHILVARDPSVVAAHRGGGGEAVVLAERDGLEWIVACRGAAETPLMPVADVPATMNGLLRFNESNAMFAAALAWAQGIDVAVIRRALSSFHNSVEQNPGRYNLIEGLPYAVLLDYAHNPDGVRELCRVAAAMPVAGRRLVGCLTVGSRHPEHVAMAAPMLAGAFDEFVLGCDPQRVGYCPDYAGDDPVATMLDRTAAALRDCGVDADRLATVAEPLEAISTVLDRAHPGDLVVLLAEPADALPVIARRRGAEL